MTRRARERGPRLGHALIDVHVEWRGECSAVHLAYERWREAPTDERAATFAAYTAALDREEHAINAYAAQARQLTTAAPQQH